MENRSKFRCDISFDSFNFEKVHCVFSQIVYQLTIQMNTLYMFNKSKTMISFVGRFS